MTIVKELGELCLGIASHGRFLMKLVAFAALCGATFLVPALLIQKLIS